MSCGNGGSLESRVPRSLSLLGATLGTWVSQLRRADPVQNRSGALSPLGKLGKSCPGNIVKHLSVPFVQP